MPLILETNGATYSQQAVFSFTPWPFRFGTCFKTCNFYLYSLNLLWAPIVDAVSWQRVGRRKTWIVSCQYLTGLFLITVAYFASGILDTADVKSTCLKAIKMYMKRVVAFENYATTVFSLFEGSLH